MATGEFDFEAVFDVDDYLYFYAELLTDQRNEAEVAALVSLLGLDTPRNILDLACGFGRHTNRLAALGHTLTGVDRSPGFLDLARQDAAARNVHVRYQLGDMRELEFEAEFDYVLLLFTAFGYFEDGENYQVLVNVHKALRPGGVFVFDTPNRDALAKLLPPFLVMEKEGNLMIDRHSFDSLQGRLYNKRIVIRDGIRKDKPNFVRIYSPSELATLLPRVGFSSYKFYGGFDGRPHAYDSGRMVVIAQKPPASDQ